MRALGMISKSHLQKCLDMARENGLVRYRGGRGRGSRGYELIKEVAGVGDGGAGAAEK